VTRSARRYHYSDPSNAREAARKRWGPPRVIDLSGCDPRLRTLLLAMVAAAKEVAERADEGAA